MRRVVPALALVPAVLVLACGGESKPPPAGPEPLVRAVADVRAPGRAVPRSFLGFSQDPAIAQSETGFPPTAGVNHVLVQLYRNLAAAGAGAPVLRIGGNGQDSAWWNPRLRPRPPGLTIDITPQYLRSISKFLDAARARVIFGLNLAIDQPELPAKLARAVLARLRPGRLASFDIGNEPDLYPDRTQRLDAAGQRVPTRPRDYDFAAYLPEFARTARALRALRPSPPLAAPGVCCPPFLDKLPTLLRRYGDDLAMVTLHRYSLLACGKKPGDEGYPDAAALLSPQVMEGNVGALAPAVAVSRRQGIAVRIAETNSVGCAGAEALSDRFAAALWAADWAFNLAAIGVNGVNFHGSSPLYQAFRTGFAPDGYRAAVKPLYYGMLLFAETVPHGARLLPRTHDRARVRGGANVQVWATFDRVDRVVRVAVINKGLQAGPAEIEVPQASGAGSVERLEAPGPLAAAGVTWGGRSIASPTRSGRLEGARATERVAPSGGTTFRVDLPAASALLLTVPVSRSP